jgi:hypothetical protein
VKITAFDHIEAGLAIKQKICELFREDDCVMKVSNKVGIDFLSKNKFIIRATLTIYGYVQFLELEMRCEWIGDSNVFVITESTFVHS